MIEEVRVCEVWPSDMDGPRELAATVMLNSVYKFVWVHRVPAPR